MSTKNLTVRLPIAEYEAMENEIAKENTSKTAIVRKSLEYYINRTTHSPVQNTPIQQATKTVVKYSKRKYDIANFSHPLLDKIQGNGIAILNEDGTQKKSIHNLKELLDFVLKNVLQDDGKV